MYLARKIDHDLYLWHYNTNDVLVVQGPPCVGKTTSIQHYVKENFAYYYIIDLEDKIGKKFSKKFSKDAQNSKDFNQDLSQDGDTQELHPIFSFIHSNEGALDNTKNSVLIIKNLQFSKDQTSLIKYLNQFDFRLICTLEDTLAKYSNIVCSPYTYIVRMTGFAFQEFLGLYEAEEDYITTVDGIGVQEDQAEVENEERNDIWFADALEVYQNVGCYPEVVETYYNNGDYCNEIYDQILKVCKTIARREDVSEVFVYKVLTSIVYVISKCFDYLDECVLAYCYTHPDDSLGSAAENAVVIFLENSATLLIKTTTVCLTSAFIKIVIAIVETLLLLKTMPFTFINLITIYLIVHVSGFVIADSLIEPLMLDGVVKEFCNLSIRDENNVGVLESVATIAQQFKSML